tara:strand:+ start:50 stop:901 length:852 start_codon:yes stop_codon:yes gene_type:complete
MEIVTLIAPIALALIMLGLGLGLTVGDFVRVIKNPKDFLVGFICQLIILPIIAIILILVLRIPSELALGIMIIAAAPGGVTSNILTKFADGDVALSISLTAIISLISIISVPLIIFQSANLLDVDIFSKDLSMIGVSLKMFLVVVVPVLLGMMLRKFFESFILSIIEYFNKINVFLFIIVFIAIWIEEKENIFYYLTQSGLYTLILNIVMMVLAYLIAKKFVSGTPQVKCIALECGIQNGTLAVFAATQIFDDIIFIIPTATYALIMYVTGFAFMLLLRRSTN